MFQAPNPRQSPQNQLPSFGQIVNTSLSPPSQQRPFGSGGIAAGFGSPSAFGGSTNVASFGSTAAFGSSSSTSAPGFGSTAALGGSSSKAAGFGNTTAFGSSGTNAPGFGNTAAFGSSSSNTNAVGFGSTAAFGSSSTNAAGFGGTAAFGSSSTNAAGFGSTAAFGSSSTNTAGFGSSTAFGSSNTNAAGFGSTAAFGSSGSGNQKTASFSSNTFASPSASPSSDQLQSRPSTFALPTSLPKLPPPPQSNTSSFTTSPKSQNVTSSGGHGGTDAISFARVAADHPPTGIFSVKSEKNPFGGVGHGAGAFGGNGNNNNNSGSSIAATTSSSVFGGGQNPFGRSSFPPAFSATTKAEPQVLKVKNSNPFLNAPTDNVFSRSQTSNITSDNPPAATLPSTAFGAFVSYNTTSTTALPSTGFGTFNSKTVLSTATTASSPFTSPVTLSATPALLPSPPSFPGPLKQQTSPSAAFTKSVFGSRGDASSSSGSGLAKPSTGSFLPLSKNSSIGDGERNAFKGDAKPMQSAFARKSIAKVFGGVPLSESKRSSASFSTSSDPNTGSVGHFGKSNEKHSSFSKTSSSGKYSTEVPAPSLPSKTGLFGKPEGTGSSRADPRTAGSSAADDTSVRSSLSPSTSKLRTEGSSHRASSYAYMDDNEDECDEDRLLSVAQRAVSASKMEMDKMSKAPVASRFYSKTMDSAGRLALSRKRGSITDDGRHRKVPKPRSEYDLMRSSSRSKMSRNAMRQRQLSEELETHPVLVCKNIPPKYNQVPFLRKHFSNFGAVQRVTRNLAKHGANIHFKDHKSAAHAKMKGFKLARGVHIQIFWQTNPLKQPLTSYVDLDTEPPDESKRHGHMPHPSSRRSRSPPPSPPPPPSTSGRRDRQQQPSWMSDEVEEELRLMAGTSDISGDFVQTLVRREEAEAPPGPMTKRGAATGVIGYTTATSSSSPLSQKSDSPSRRHHSSHHHHHHHHQPKNQQEHRRKVQKQPSPAPSGVSSQLLTPVSVPGSAATHRKRPSSSSPSMTSQSAFDDAKKSSSAVQSTVRSYSSVVAGHGTTASTTTTTTTISTTTTTTTAAAAPTTTTSLFGKSEHSSMIFGSFHGDTDVQKANVTISASRVQLLDQRDRAIRSAGLKKKPNLATAKALIGTCPDMCPEKERYDREAKRRLHVFEMLPATKMNAYPQVDHARAVKEYSRSSADQEEPLSHELRPGPVLVRTMNYLLSEIANMGQDGLWAEWFDFLWDRSRGIRKDITQQMMCSSDAVALIEKCVRFHVFASERLCEEDISMFSPKINNENLTKCLQSLKYLYADLDKKKKICFDTEAEFRSYMVLMNLNQGDILREVQTLRPEVRTSSEIHFALQVYSALNSNNYIKFFKLARTATFLSSCIIHRYFMQVRSKALRILRKALTFGTKPVAYPLSELVRTLCFESTSEAGTFCMHYGFTVEGPDVLLDRSSFIEPEVAPCLVRSVNFIESKCTRPIGEVINGGPLQPVELPSPINSFNEDGNLKQEVLSKEVLQAKKDSVTMETETSEGPDTARHLPSETAKPAIPCDVQPAVTTEATLWQGSEIVTPSAEVPFDPAGAIVQQQQQQQLQQGLREQHQQRASKSTLLLIKEIAKDLFLEVIATFAKEISQEFYQKSEQLRDIASEVQQSITEDVVNREICVIAQEVHTESTADGAATVPPRVVAEPGFQFEIHDRPSLASSFPNSWSEVTQERRHTATLTGDGAATAATHVADAVFQFEICEEQVEEDDEEEERLRRLLEAKTEELKSLSREDEGEVTEIEEEEEYDEDKLLEDDEEEEEVEEEEEEQQAEVEVEKKREKQEQEAEILSVQEMVDSPFVKQKLEERSQEEVENKRKEEEEEKYKKAMAERVCEQERAMLARAVAEHEAKKRQEEEKQVTLLKAQHKAEEREMRERLRAKKAAAEKETEEERKRLAAEEEEQRRKRVTEEVIEQMLEEHVVGEAQSVARQQMSDIEKELHARLVEECCQRATEGIMHEVVSELCTMEGRAFYRTDVELRLETLHKAERCVQLYKMKKVLECWKRRQLQRQHERNMTTFPSWPSLAPLDKQLKTLCGKEHRGVVGDALVMEIGRMARLSMETPLAISRRDNYLPLALTLCHMRRHLIQQKAWYPLDLATTVGPTLLSSSSWDTQTRSGRNSGSLCWKLIMSLPELDEQQTDNATMYSLELSDWLKAKLSKGAKPKSDVDNMPILSLYKCRLEEGSSLSSVGRQQGDTTLHFCLREVTGSLTPDLIRRIESKRLFCGTSGLLFVLPLLGIDEDKEKYWLDAQIRLCTLLQAKPQQPSLPVAILVPHDETGPGSPPSLEQLQLKLDLPCFINQELVSSVEVFALPFRCHEESGFDVEHVAVETVLSNCLRWLATHLPCQPNLEKKPLKDFVEDFLASQFYGPLLYNRGLRSAEGYLQQPPDVVIDFYNSILQHSIDCVTDPALTSYSWPVTEFVDATAQGSHDSDLPPIHWNSPEHLLFVRDTLRSLMLPPFTFADITSEKWSQAVQDVQNYTRSVALERSGKSAVDLVSRVRHHIHQVEKQFDEVCRRLKYGVSNCSPTYVNMPWVDIILDCVNHCLTTVSCLDPKSTNSVRATELCVLYEKEKLHSYQAPQSWSEAAIVEKTMRESCNLESTFYRSIDIRSKELQQARSARKALHQDKPSGWDSTHDNHSQLAETVRASISAECTKSDGFESFLMQSLVAGDLQYEDDGAWQEERDWYPEFYPRDIGSAGVDDGDDDDDGKEEEEGKILKRKDTFDRSVEPGCGSLEPHALESKLPPGPVSYPGDFSIPNIRDRLSLEERLSILRDEIAYNKRTDSVMEHLLQSFLIDESLEHDDVLFAEDCG